MFHSILLIDFPLFPSGEKDIPGLTDSTVPRRLGPKRASRIRKLFNLSKEDDVRQYVVRRPVTKEGMTAYAQYFSCVEKIFHHETEPTILNIKSIGLLLKGMHYF